MTKYCVSQKTAATMEKLPLCIQWTITWSNWIYMNIEFWQKFANLFVTITLPKGMKYLFSHIHLLVNVLDKINRAEDISQRVIETVLHTNFHEYGYISNQVCLYWKLFLCNAEIECIVERHRTGFSALSTFPTKCFSKFYFKSNMRGYMKSFKYFFLIQNPVRKTIALCLLVFTQQSFVIQQLLMFSIRIWSWRIIANSKSVENAFTFDFLGFLYVHTTIMLICLFFFMAWHVYALLVWIIDM